MWDSVALAQVIGTSSSGIDALLEHLNKLESDFATLMGDLLQDGYYSDNTYGPGQEQALYNDSYEMMKVLSRPQMTYNLTEKDIVNCEGYSDEVYTINIAVHFYEDILGINDYGFVSQIEEYLDRANTRGVEVKTDELNIQGKSFASFLGRITDAAQMLKDKQAIYDLAKALSPDGTLATYKLNGIIDVLTNQLVSTKSNWSTDENGNIIFVAADESSAMMLSGAGFMVANGKKDDGSWNWRTFGTGEGFTADLITAGILRAGAITILGSEQFYWNEDNIYILDPSNKNRQIRIGRYDTTKNDMGIAYTTDGGNTWQTAIGFDGIHLSAVDVGKGGRNYIRYSRSLGCAIISTLMSILVQPQNANVSPGQKVTFTVVATHVQSYQWRIFNTQTGSMMTLPQTYDGVTYSGTQTNSLSFTMPSGFWADARYNCQLMDEYGGIIYSTLVTAHQAAAPIIITQQPVTVVQDTGAVTFNTHWSGNIESATWQYTEDYGTTWKQITTGSDGYAVSTSQSESTLAFAIATAKYGRVYRCHIVGYNYSGVVDTNVVTVVPIEQRDNIIFLQYPQTINAKVGDVCTVHIDVYGANLFAWTAQSPLTGEDIDDRFDGTDTPTVTFTMAEDLNGVKLLCTCGNDYEEKDTPWITIQLV